MKRRELGDDPRDTELGERLWQASAKLTGVDIRR
jgi:hypothetical protein